MNREQKNSLQFLVKSAINRTQVAQRTTPAATATSAPTTTKSATPETSTTSSTKPATTKRSISFALNDEDDSDIVAVAKPKKSVSLSIASPQKNDKSASNSASKSGKVLKSALKQTKSVVKDTAPAKAAVVMDMDDEEDDGGLLNKRKERMALRFAQQQQQQAVAKKIITPPSANFTLNTSKNIIDNTTQSALKRKQPTPIDNKNDGDDDDDDDNAELTKKPTLQQIKRQKANTTPESKTATGDNKKVSLKDAGVVDTKKVVQKKEMPGFVSLADFDEEVLKPVSGKSSSKTTKQPMAKKATTISKVNKKAQAPSSTKKEKEMPGFMSFDDFDNDMIEETFNNDEAEIEADGFMSFDDEEEEQKIVQPKKKTATTTTTTKKASSTTTVAHVVKKANQTTATTKKSLTKSTFKPKEEKEVEFDGFMTFDDDEEENFTPQPPSTTKNKKQATITKPLKKSVKMAVASSSEEDEDEEEDEEEEENDSDDNTGNNNNNILASTIKSTYVLPKLLQPPPQPKSSPQHIVDLVVYYPQQQSTTTTSDNKNTKSTTKTQQKQQIIKVPCYDLTTYCKDVHNKLIYPSLGNLHHQMVCLLTSEVHKRFFYSLLPLPLYTSHPSRTSNANQLISNILAEEMIRKLQSSTLYNAFNRCFAQLKDNTFNNFEQWIIRNISIQRGLLPTQLPPSNLRLQLSLGLEKQQIKPQCFVQPTIYNHHNLTTQQSRDFQSKLQNNRDILFHTPQRLQSDNELKQALTQRGLNKQQIKGAIDTYSKAVGKSIEEIKKAQYIFHEKGSHPKDTAIRVHEVIRPNIMKKDIADIYDHIREWHGVDIVFTTSIGPISLSIPHTVKLIILYIATYIFNNCLNDNAIKHLSTILPPNIIEQQNAQNNNINSTIQFQHINDKELNNIESFLEKIHPELISQYTPNLNDDQNDDNNKNNQQSTAPQLSPFFTQQVIHNLRLLQSHLPSQTIIYQYISMLLSGYESTPKIGNLKLTTQSLGRFPQYIAQSIVNSLLRYEGLHGGQHRHGGGNQAAVPPEFLRSTNNILGINFEAFASPFNSFFNTYCTAFPDVDTPFGSTGSFFQYTPLYGNIFVNPPFANDTILASIIHAEQLLSISNGYNNNNLIESSSSSKKQQQQQGNNNNNTKIKYPILNANNNGLMFFFVFPYKEKELFTKWIVTSPFCTLYTILPARQHIYTIGRQEFGVDKERYYRPARHETIVCILQNERSKQLNPITTTKLQKMLQYFMIYNPNPNEDNGMNDIDGLDNEDLE